jgi:ribonuclease HII
MLKHFPSIKIIAGCDEAGRGCLAGPVVAAAVILPKNFRNKILNDSKVLSKKKRDLLRTIIEKQAITYAIGIVSPDEIDKINILNASFLAMHRAIENLSIKAELLIIDGNRFNPYSEIPHECIIKGDGKFMSIAAASILAKTYRDDIMKKLDIKFPDYHWKNNKGYPTKQHRKAIAEIGANKHHRKTFQLLPVQLTLSL